MSLGFCFGGFFGGWDLFSFEAAHIYLELLNGYMKQNIIVLLKHCYICLYLHNEENLIADHSQNDHQFSPSCTWNQLEFAKKHNVY